MENLEKKLKPFASPKEDGEEFDMFKYRTLWSMALGLSGAVTAPLIGPLIAPILDNIFGTIERGDSVADPFRLVKVFVCSTVIVYGGSLAYDGVRKLINKEYKPTSWFL